MIEAERRAALHQAMIDRDFPVIEEALRGDDLALRRAALRAVRTLPVTDDAAAAVLTDASLELRRAFYQTWTASDFALTFAVVRRGFPLPIAVVRSAQSSGFGPSSIESASAGGPLCVAWTGTDGTGALNVAALNADAIRNGTDPISTVYTLPETSRAAPTLLYRPLLRTLAIFWTGTDGAGTLNACDVQL